MRLRSEGSTAPVRQLLRKWARARARVVAPPTRRALYLRLRIASVCGCPRATIYPRSSRSLWNTFGGPRRNPRGHVLDVHGEVIPGLYGCGECGSVLGFLYAGGGWNIMETVASGRIAGEEAAAQEPRA